MYTEERKGHLLKEFLLKLILIIIFVLLLIWLVPWPNMKGYIDALNPLKSQIFNANIQEMKNAAIPYYTTERLPQKVGDIKKITLQEMLNMKLLIPFVDKDGNSCDVVNSYVSIEKKETEYLMKVNLKCGDEEDYILVHLGCYSYCSTDICEKETITQTVVKPVPTSTSTPKSTPTPKPSPQPIPTIIPTPKPEPEKHYCEIVNGKYYDKKGNVVDKVAYEKDCTTPKPEPEKHYCEIVNGKYYDKKGNVVDKVAYEKDCTTPKPEPEKHYCEIVNGKYYDKKGNVVDKVAYEKDCTTPKPDPVKEYEYKKTVPTTCTNWSSWTTKILKNNETITEVNTVEKVVEDLGFKKVQIGKKNAVYEKVVFTYPQLVQVGTHDYKVCTGYNYVVTGTTITQVSGDWQNTGQEYRGYNPPSNPSSTSKWVPVGVDYSVCGSSCTNHPYTIWNLYTRSGNSYASEASVTATCTSVETRSIPLYITRTITETKTVKKEDEKPIYGNVHFYREKTCQTVNPETTTYVWSAYNDTTLLNSGYTYTGKTRNK
ncbi:MAG: hypothetical protein PUB18_03040 [bacterium]|nr:hypothetical protein [bacterium]